MSRCRISLETLLGITQNSPAVRHVHFHGINVQVGDMEWITAPALAHDFLSALRAADLLPTVEVEAVEDTLNVWF